MVGGPQGSRAGSRAVPEIAVLNGPGRGSDQIVSELGREMVVVRPFRPFRRFVIRRSSTAGSLVGVVPRLADTLVRASQEAVRNVLWSALTSTKRVVEDRERIVRSAIGRRTLTWRAANQERTVARRTDGNSLPGLRRGCVGSEQFGNSVPTPPMPLRKSHLYSSLWQSCDQLRGGMDASQYKDYVLTQLFMKYVSDKYAGSGDFADITVPPGGSFADMVDLKGTKEIGDGINKVIGRLADANDYLLKGVIDQADFNDESKLGKGKEMQDRLSKLVGIPVGQEQGTVLHPGGSLPHHGPGDRHRPGHQAGSHDQGTTRETNQRTTQNRILDHLRADPELTRRELAERVGVTPDEFKVPPARAAGRSRSKPVSGAVPLSDASEDRGPHPLISMHFLHFRFP